MTQVSRKPLSVDTWEKVFDMFLHTFVSINKKSELSKLLYDLLSPTERVMLAKRLAIALLLVKHHSYDSIKERLHVTSTTIAKIQRLLHDGQGGLQIGIDKISSLQSQKLVWEQLNDLLDISPPSFHKSDWGKRKFKRKQKIDEIKYSF